MASLPSYDPTGAPSLSLTPSQLGSSGLNNSTWTTQTFPLATSLTVYPGFGFDFGVSNDSERGLALAPRIPFTAATDDLAGTGETPAVWTLTLNTNNSSKEAVSAQLFGVATHTPTAFATDNDPFTLATTSGSSFLISTITVASSEWSLNESGLYDLVWGLDFMDDHTLSVSGTTVSSPLFAATNDSVWTGLIQLFLVPSAFWTVSITAATFVGRAHNWHTGLMGTNPNIRGRAVHDYKTGQPYMSNEAVEDGYQDGIMVHPDNFDPSDPAEDDPFTPPPGEGVVDDNIVDLE